MRVRFVQLKTYEMSESSGRSFHAKQGCHTLPMKGAIVWRCGWLSFEWALAFSAHWRAQKASQSFLAFCACTLQAWTLGVSSSGFFLTSRVDGTVAKMRCMGLALNSAIARWQVLVSYFPCNLGHGLGYTTLLWVIVYCSEKRSEDFVTGLTYWFLLAIPLSLLWIQSAAWKARFPKSNIVLRDLKRKS